jgi:hypothetical protein
MTSDASQVQSDQVKDSIHRNDNLKIHSGL